MKSLLRLLPVVVLAVLLAVVGGVSSASAQSSVVGPGESIQKAINAAHPGDTIIVRGVHKEDVVVRKDGIKLRGEDAVIEAPPRARADSPCSKVFGPEGICILGGVNLQNGELTGPRVSDIGVSGFTFRGFEQTEDGTFAIDAPGARDAAIVGNRFLGNGSGAIGLGRNVDTTIAKNRIVGDLKANSEGIVVGASSNTNIVNNVVRNIPEGNQSAIVVEGAIATTVADNTLENDWVGTFVVDSPGTKILSNDMSRSGFAGTLVVGQKAANAKVLGNNISGGAWGIYVGNTKGGSFAGNTIHDNCAGMGFDAFKAEPVGGFEVKGNTIEDNTRSCRAAQFERNFSGIGIALLGASGMEVTGNQISGNVPSGPTRILGGVVLSTNPYFGGSAKPRNNSVTGNHFGRNKPDIFYDGSGSGNVFRANNCNTSVPSRLCN